MNISRLVEKIFIRLFLIVTLIPLQSCSNTLIGEKLESSFDIIENPRTSVKTSSKPQKLSEKTKIKSRIKDNKKENDNDFGKIYLLYFAIYLLCMHTNITGLSACTVILL